MAVIKCISEEAGKDLLKDLKKSKVNFNLIKDCEAIKQRLLKDKRRFYNG